VLRFDPVLLTNLDNLSLLVRLIFFIGVPAFYVKPYSPWPNNFYLCFSTYL